MSAAGRPGKAAGPLRTESAQTCATAGCPAHAASAAGEAAARADRVARLLGRQSPGRPREGKRACAGEAPARLHNMSAPPRATITFRALAGPRPAEREDRAAASGLRWVCRIDLPGVFRPVPEGTPRDPAEVLVWPYTLELERCLLAQALAEERGSNEPDEALCREVAALPAEALHEALREAAARADPIALGLPYFGLLRPAHHTLPRSRLGAMRVALAVLARRRGAVFVAGAEPLSPSSLYEPLDLWAVDSPPHAGVDAAAGARAGPAAPGPALVRGSPVGAATPAPSGAAGAAAWAARRPDAGLAANGGTTR